MKFSARVVRVSDVEILRQATKKSPEVRLKAHRYVLRGESAGIPVVISIMGKNGLNLGDTPTVSIVNEQATIGADGKPVAPQ
jgi:uncharacterized protein YccT (UPF0319 family)